MDWSSLDWPSFLDAFIKMLLAGISSFGLKMLFDIKTSIDTLNKQVSQIVERTDWHTKEIDRLDQRMNSFETRRARNGSAIKTDRLS